MAKVDLVPAMLTSVMLESLLLGIFLVLCTKSLVVLRVHEMWRSKDVNRIMLVVAFTFLISITTHWILACQILYQAFIVAVNSPYGTLLYFANNHNPVYLAIQTLYIFVSVIADSFMTYRTYIVWGRNPWMIVFPAMSTMALTGGTGVVVELYLSPMYYNNFTSAMKPWTSSSLVATLCTNLWCSAFITYRIWQSQKLLIELGEGLDGLPAMKKKLKRTFMVFVESAALFTIVTLASLICYVMQTSLLFVMINMAVPIVGICFCSIVVSVGGNVDDRSGEYSSATFGSIPRFRQADRVYALSPMTARTSKTSLHDDNVASQLP